ncbi:MAG: hypothetical protein ACKV19_15720 [Verrucomicrobiales bacterium]
MQQHGPFARFGSPLCVPPPERIVEMGITRFTRFVKDSRGVASDDSDSLIALVIDRALEFGLYWCSKFAK